MRVPTLIDTFRCVDSTLCCLKAVVIFVRCSVVSFAEPAAPWPVVALRFCSVVDWLVVEGLVELFGVCAFCSLFERTSVSDLPDAAEPDLLSILSVVCPAFSSDFGACPVVSRALPDFA